MSQKRQCSKQAGIQTFFTKKQRVSDASTSADLTQSDAPQADSNDRCAPLPYTSADNVEKVPSVEKSPSAVPVTNVSKKPLDNQSKMPTQEMLEDLFPGEKSRIHHHDICDAGCTFSREEISRQLEANKGKKKEKLFNHAWLCKADIAYCAASGYWWPVFVEGEGVYCILCKKHNVHSTQNKQEKFSAEPSVRFKSSALVGHLNSRTHNEVIQLEHTQRGSIFQREVSNRKAAEAKTIESVMRNLYFLMKEEISNRKAAHLNELVALQGGEEIKYFQHRSQRVQKEMMLALGDAVCNSFLPDAQAARCFGLLIDDLTDIAVQEQMICFIQYVDKKASKHTKFLFTTNLLSGESSSANSPTIKAAVLQGLENKSLDTRKFASVCTDGASVMTGEQNGLAGLLRRDFPAILTFHCVCHRLALATVDTSKEDDVKYIDNVHNCLRQVWQLLENSPKKMATFIKIQANVNTVQLSAKGKKAVATKLQKACKTRWLSFEASVKSVKKCIYPLLLALKELEPESATAGGLYKKMYSGYFLGTLYLLGEVLPILSTLSKTFQKGELSYAHIKGSIGYAKAQLNQLLEEAKKTEFIKNLTADLRNGPLSATNIELTQSDERRLANLKVKYVTSLIQNIDKRFSKCQDIFSAFKVFHPGLIPRKEHPDFKSYGEADVMLLAKHFFSNDVDQFMAEWHRFKFDLIDFQGDMEFSLRQLCQSQKQYPLLSEVAEICYSAPVTNAWPERGASAVKRIKTRLRSLLKDDMLNVLLQVSINGPTLADADSIIQDATKHWLNDKSRYKLKRVNQPRQPPKENAELPRAAFFSAATQTDIVIDLNKEAEEEEQSKEQEAEMIVAESLGLAGEDCTEQNISDEDSGLDSVSEDEF